MQLIWTAAVASNASTPSLYGSRQTTVLCKDADGRVVPCAAAEAFRSWTHASEKDRKSPLMRITQLFNVNHFIVSQARPYLVPFLQSDMHGPSPPPSLLTRFFFSFSLPSGGGGGGGDGQMVTSHLFRVVGLELRHRLRQLDALGFLPVGIRRFLVDEEVPGGAPAATLTLVPDVAPADFVKLLLDTPTHGAALDAWIRRGERSVWPAVAALTARCAVELELERAYQRARRLKAGGLRRKGSTAGAAAPPAPGEVEGLGVRVGGVVDRGVSGGQVQLQHQQQQGQDALATAAVFDDDDGNDYSSGGGGGGGVVGDKVGPGVG